MWEACKETSDLFGVIFLTTSPVMMLVAETQVLIATIFGSRRFIEAQDFWANLLLCSTQPTQRKGHSQNGQLSSAMHLYHLQQLSWRRQPSPLPARSPKFGGLRVVGRGQPSKSRGSSPRASIIDIDVNVYINIWDSHLVPEWIWVKPLDWSCHGGWSQLTDANPMTIYDQAFMPKWFAKPWA